MDNSLSLNNQSFGELLQLWSQIRQVLIEKNSEIYALNKKLEIMDSKQEWYLQNIQQFTEDADKLKQLISSQQNKITEFSQFKEECIKLQNTIMELNACINDKEDAHNAAIVQMKREFELELQQLNNQLTDSLTRDTDQKLKQLSDITGEKDKQIKELQTDVELIESSKERELSKMKSDYESKIQQTNENLNAYQRIAEQTEQTCKLKCLQTIEQIKSDFEQQLFALRQENQQLKDNVSYLNLELDARKAQPMNASTSGLNVKSSATKPKSSEKIAIKILNFGPNDLSEQLSKPSVSERKLQNPKRKRLPPCNPEYLDYLNQMFRNA